MAIRLGAKDTYIVLTALWDYRETLTIHYDIKPTLELKNEIKAIDRLIASYKKSYFALDRLGLM
jgi:hypothetical protein